MTVDATPVLLPAGVLGGGLAGEEDAEAASFNDSLSGPALQESWRWEREEPGLWSFRGDGLEWTMKPNVLTGGATDLPAVPRLVRSLSGANACEVTVSMPDGTGSMGEQAGLFWHLSSDDYAKLVVQWGENGAASVTLAHVRANLEPVVCGEISLDEDEVHEPIRLRLEQSADSRQLSGVVVGAYYMRLVGSCEVLSDVAPAAASISLSAQGGKAEGDLRVVHFSKFAAIAVRANRVQWDGVGSLTPQQLGGPPPSQEGYSPPAPGMGLSDFSGLTLSPALSEEQRAQVAAMLMSAQFGDSDHGPAGNQPPAGGPNK